MGFRYRKSISLGGGVRLNLSKGGVGWSVGGKGYRYTHSPRGYDRRTLSVPGTGLSHVTQKSRSRRAAGGAVRDTRVLVEPDAALLRAPKPPSPDLFDLFASKYEKEFAAGVNYLHAQQLKSALEAFERASRADDRDKAQADDLMVGLLHAQFGEVEQAIPPLEKVVASDIPLPDALITKYLSTYTTTVTYAGGFLAERLPLDSITAGVVLAECYRKRGRTNEAIGLLQQLAGGRPDPHFFVALAELYLESNHYEDLASLVQRPDVQRLGFQWSAAIDSFYAKALLEQGKDEEAFATLESSYLAWYAVEKKPFALLALCRAFLEAERWDDVIRTVASYGVTNSDDDGFRIKLIEAQAMEAKDLNDAALTIYKDLLTSKPRDVTKLATTAAQMERQRRQRDPELLKEARYRRGTLYLKMGRNAMGNRDLSAVYADDPNYKDVAQLLQEP